MNHEQREEFIQSQLLKCQEIRASKNIEYANSDKEANKAFHSDSDIGLTAFQSIAVYINKHYRSIRNWVKTGQVFSEEKIEGRIYDLINYLLILLSLIEEKKQE